MQLSPLKIIILTDLDRFDAYPYWTLWSIKVSHQGFVLFIEHHTNFIILYPCKQYTEDIGLMNLIAVILTQYWYFMKSKMKRTSQFAWKKITYCHFKLQFSHNNIFPHVSVCQNSDEIKATDQHNIKDVFFCKFVHILTDRNKSQKTLSRNNSWFYKSVYL